MLKFNASTNLELSERGWHRLMLVLLGVLAGCVVLTFHHYGITWDEELQSQYGFAVVDYYQSLFHDKHYAQIFNLYLYGGMFDGLAAIFSRLTPYTVYETRHFLNAVFGVLGLWGTWRLGRHLGGGAVGFVALSMLALTPMYYGHMFNNPKDIPFACGVVWSCFFMVRILTALPRPDIDTIFKLSLIYGLTLGVRVGGVMLLAFWLLVMGLSMARPLMTGASLRTVMRLSVPILLRVALPVMVLSYGVMLFCWPWAQEHPLLNPLRALGQFSNFPQDVEVLLDGTIHRSTKLPWTYLPLYFGIQLPEFLLLALVAFIASLPLVVRVLPWDRRFGLLLIGLMALFPTAYACLRHPALYDAVRHFIFVVPLLCVMASLGVVTSLRWAVAQFDLPISRMVLTLSVLLLGGIVAVGQMATMVRLHPYEYIYANYFAGGVSGIYGKYELDYWGTSFKEATEQLQAYVGREGGIPAGKIYRVAICGPWDAAMIYLPPDYQAVVANEEAEFFLSTTRWMCQNMRPGREIIRVERDGVPLSIIKDLRPGN